MNTPLLTWFFIIGMVMLVMAIDAIAAFRKNYKKVAIAHRLIDIVSERELFYVPGDPDPLNTDHYDYEDFDDI